MVVVEREHFTPVKPVVHEQAWSETKRPCTVFQDVTFSNPTTVVYLDVRNYFTATVQILMPPSSFSGKPGTYCDMSGWTTVLPTFRLMKHPHYENDAEDWHRFNLLEACPALKDVGVKLLRFILDQPSPNWRTFELRNYTFYTSCLRVENVDSGASNTRAGVDAPMTIKDATPAASAATRMVHMTSVYNEISTQCRKLDRGDQDLAPSNLFESLDGGEMVHTVVIPKGERNTGSF